MDRDSVLSGVDAGALAAAACQALGRDRAEILEWQARSIHKAFNPVTGGLFRVSGAARDRGETLRWSLVVKIARNTVDHFGGSLDDPSHPNYWKREALLYQSRLLDRLPPGLATPRCYGVTEPTPDTAWIWLEDVVESVSRWPVERYGLAARHLGRFNGAYLVGRPLPTDNCLTCSWLRATVAEYPPMYSRVPEACEDPRLRRHGWSAELLDRQQRFVAQQDLFLDALERLPVTFCHLDAFRGNLLARRGTEGREETVAVDWSFSGYGAIGQELYPMVAAPILFGQVDPDQMAALDSAIFEGYLEGLRDAGWRGEAGLARLGCTAATALRWGGAPYWMMVLDPGFAAVVERTSGHTLEENLERSALLARFVLDLADEARELMSAT